MDDLDTSTGGDSTQSGTPASDAGRGALDASWLIDFLPSSPAEGRPAAAREAGPTAEERRRRAQFEASLRELFLAAGPARDDRSLARRVVEAPCWYVPLGPDGSVARLPALGADDLLRHAFTRPLAAGAAPRRWTLGRRAPAGLLLARTGEPRQPARRLTGRELAWQLPADAPGALFLFEHGEAIGLWRDELGLLQQAADALDLEAILAAPGPGQLAALRSARWYVPASKQSLSSETFGSARLVFVYTHPDHAEASDGPLVELDGQTLCTRLASRGDYDGVGVNIGAQVGTGDLETRGLVLGPAFARGIARGVDPRPGAEPLAARTRAEMLLWLDLASFPAREREIVELPSEDGRTLLQARADTASTWRVVETLYPQTERPGPVWSPVFAVADPAAPPGYLGDGQTRILCAGKLARHLYYRQNTWRPPRWLVTPADRARAARLWSWARELEKLLRPGAERLPRAAILTLEGAEWLRSRPAHGSRAWIEEQIQRYEPAALRRLTVPWRIGW